MRRLHAPVVAIVLATLCAAWVPASVSADFGFRSGSEGFSAAPREEDGSLDHRAGSHPFRLTTSVNFNLAPESPGEPGVPFADGEVRNLRLDLPPGMIENPSAVPRCPQAVFHTPRVSPFEASHSGESCPDVTQIGTVTLRSSFGGGDVRTFRVFNLEPPPGAPSEIGFNPYGAPIVFIPEIRQSGGEYQLIQQARNMPQRVSITGMTMNLWGVPWLPSHNAERGDCLNEENPAQAWGNDCGTGERALAPAIAYLTLPSSCQQPLAFTVTAESWQGPASSTRREFLGFGRGDPLYLEGCGDLGFEPAVTALIGNPRASSPSGFDFNLDVGSEGLLRPHGLNPAPVKKAVVKLPRGMTINPSVGSGLLGCTPSQYAAETKTSAPGAGCPNGAKIGDFSVESPLFPEKIDGSLYLAAPFDNPFGTLIGIYLVAKNANRGVLVKVAGKLDADPGDGSLVATFDGLPQLPYSDLRIHFREGQRSPLTTPSACSAFTTGIDLTPWSTAAAAVHVDAPTPIEIGVEGTPCPVGLPAFGPAAQAGSINSHASSFSPFYIHLTRKDTEQEFTSYSTVLPPGLLGRVAGIPYCSEEAIEAARRRGGFEELESPSCPPSTEIGHTVSGYGVGPALNFAEGGLYLAGPFHGSTLSIVAIDSATVGPFDLGTVVVRSAIDVDPQSAQVSLDSAGSDPIPHIIDGIPIHLRDIRVYISKDHFTVNPTSCAPMSVASALTGSGEDFASSADDTSAIAAAPYQAFDCAALPFQPRLSLRLRGGTVRGAYPSLRAEVRPRPGDANISSARVTLPASEFLEQSHIKEICTRPQFAREACPAGSAYGSAQAFSPLLAQPLTGNVYLRSSPDRPLPDLVADLHGGGLGLRIEVVGHIDSANGGLRATFKTVPDAPVSRFVMNLKGGQRSLLVNSVDVCEEPQFANAVFVGHNNVGVRLKPKLKVNCGKSTSKKGKR